MSLSAKEFNGLSNTSKLERFGEMPAREHPATKRLLERQMIKDRVAGEIGIMLGSVGTLMAIGNFAIATFQRAYQDSGGARSCYIQAALEFGAGIAGFTAAHISEVNTRTHREIISRVDAYFR